jgi:hypothetical protein
MQRDIKLVFKGENVENMVGTMMHPSLTRSVAHGCAGSLPPTGGDAAQTDADMAQTGSPLLVVNDILCRAHLPESTSWGRGTDERDYGGVDLLASIDSDRDSSELLVERGALNKCLQKLQVFKMKNRWLEIELSKFQASVS